MAGFAPFVDSVMIRTELPPCHAGVPGWRFIFAGPMRALRHLVEHVQGVDLPAGDAGPEGSSSESKKKIVSAVAIGGPDVPARPRHLVERVLDQIVEEEVRPAGDAGAREVARGKEEHEAAAAANGRGVLSPVPS